MEYRGWTYRAEDILEIYDRETRTHIVTSPNGCEFKIRHSAYDTMAFASFVMHVENDFPRLDCGTWDNHSISHAYEFRLSPSAQDAISEHKWQTFLSQQMLSARGFIQTHGIKVADAALARIHTVLIKRHPDKAHLFSGWRDAKNRAAFIRISGDDHLSLLARMQAVFDNAGSVEDVRSVA